MFNYNVENRKSPVHGEGLYTLEDIKKGSIVFYWGMDEGDKPISEEEYLEKRKDKSDETYQKTAARWVYNRFMHCTEWGLDCYINHSFNPNILYYCGIGFAKRDIKKGIIISISTFEEKVGVAIRITNELVSKYDAVSLVKIASKILEGKGGGGRKDFAQAGGTNKNKIDDVFKAITDKIS